MDLLPTVVWWAWSQIHFSWAPIPHCIEGLCPLSPAGAPWGRGQLINQHSVWNIADSPGSSENELNGWWTLKSSSFQIDRLQRNAWHTPTTRGLLADALTLSSGCPSLPITFRPFAATHLILLGILLDRGPPSNKLKLIWNKIHTHTHRPLLKIHVYTQTHTHTTDPF